MTSNDKHLPHPSRWLQRHQYVAAWSSFFLLVVLLIEALK
jgi:hypothetical protein